MRDHLIYVLESGLRMFQILVKPPVKESTKPVNLMLHSDTRAMERAEFDNQVKPIFFKQSH